MSHTLLPPGCQFRVLFTTVCLGLASHSIVANAVEQADIDRLERQIHEERKRLDDLEEQLNRLKGIAQSDANEKTETLAEAKTDQTEPATADTEPNNSRQLIAAEGRSDPYVDNDFNKSVPLFGSPWRFSFGGYAKTDLIHDFSGTGNKQQFVLGQIPVDNSPLEGSYSHMQVS